MKKIIDKAYALLSHYQAKSPLDICTVCCMELEDEQLLAQLAPREIPLDLLTQYNDGAATEKTPINELKHFLPRYLELISLFESPSHSIEIALKRLDPFDEKEWTKEELFLLKEFANQFFDTCLSIYPLPSGETIDSILIMLSKGQFDITSLLALWTTKQDHTSLLHLKDLLFNGFSSQKQNKLVNAFGEKPLAILLANWINKKEVKIQFSNLIETILWSNKTIAPDNSQSLEDLYTFLDCP